LGNEILDPEAGKVVSSNLPNKSIDMNSKCALHEHLLIGLTVFLKICH
jgi:hypothetical protein